MRGGTRRYAGYYNRTGVSFNRGPETSICVFLSFIIHATARRCAKARCVPPYEVLHVASHRAATPPNRCRSSARAKPAPSVRCHSPSTCSRRRGTAQTWPAAIGFDGGTAPSRYAGPSRLAHSTATSCRCGPAGRIARRPQCVASPGGAAATIFRARRASRRAAPKGPP